MITRAWGGELPAELSTQGLRYGEVGSVASSAFDEVIDASESLRREVMELRGRIERLEDRT